MRFQSTLCPPSYQGWAFIALAVGAVGVYLSSFLGLSLYPDEAALRFASARADVDGWTIYGLFAACVSNIKTIPLLLRPGSMALSLFDAYAGWDFLRTLPMLMLVLLSGITAWHSVPGKQRLLICGAFVGVTGGGLILLRPEWMAMLQILACMVCFAAAKRKLPLVLVLGLTLLHLFTISLSLAVHPQGLLLVPLSLLSLLRLFHGRPVFAMAVTALILMASLQNLQLYHFTCTELPQFETMITANQGSATPLVEPNGWIKRTGTRISRYAKHAAYKEFFNPPYLPAITGPVRALNVPIIAVIAANSIAVLLFLALGIRNLWRRYVPILRTTPLKQLWHQLLWDPWVLATGSALVLVFYALYDVTGTFYRAFFIHFLTVMLLAFAAPLVPQRRVHRVLGWLAVLAFATCIGSTLVNSQRIAPVMREGFSGTGSALTTHWNSIARDVSALKQRCAIHDGSPRIVADELSYQALRSNPHLIHLVYVYVDEVIQRAQFDSATPAQRLAKLRAIEPAGVIAKCSNFELFQLPHTAQSGQLCCLKP